MRFVYVLLGLVTLASLHISNGQDGHDDEDMCSNGLPGFQRGNICCSLSCGTCGGSGCGSLDGGNTNCCSGFIENNGPLCSDAGEAPCIIDNAVFCSNGFIGLDNDDAEVCCKAECGRCGGSNCGQLPGGPTSCCMSRITEDGNLCSDTMKAPCIIDNPVECIDGVTGVSRENVCCEAQCGICGGSGCALRSGGPDACCLSAIRGVGDLCSETMAAPCLLGIPLWTPLPLFPLFRGLRLQPRLVTAASPRSATHTQESDTGGGDEYLCVTPNINPPWYI